MRPASHTVKNSASARPSAFQHTQLCLAISALLVPVWSFAAPVVGPNGGVSSGTATIVQNGAVTDINQSSNKAVINWQSFSTAPNETVNFNQPNAASITLNRVIGNEQSVLQGALNATGKVFLVNPNGVLISTGATVNTGGFLASTLNITDDDFNKGNYTFKGNGSTTSVTNLGTITVTDGGYVVLMGHLVSNQGAIVATKGTVSLNAGNKVTLNFNGNSLLSVTIDEGALNALVENKQAIYADGGQVILTAKAADELLGSQVNNTGIVQAQTIDDLKGTIEIYAHGGTANIAGKLDASAPTTGDGGFIETSGDVVNIAAGTKVTTLSAQGKTGNWLIDPNDFTIAASGGNMTAADVVSNLATTNFEIKTATMGTAGGNGDIHVNQAISWNTPTILTLNAERNVNINAGITATANSVVVAGMEQHAGLTLVAGNDININAPVVLAGTKAAMSMTYNGDYYIRTKASYSGTVLDANGKPVAKQDTSGGLYGSITLNAADSTLNINGDSYTLIRSISDLEAINNNPTGHYAIVQDLTDTGTRSQAVIAELGTPTTLNYFDANGDFLLDADGNLAPVITPGTPGILAGMGHTIRDLNVDIPTQIRFAGGLFGSVQGGSLVRDLGLLNTKVNAQANDPFGFSPYAGSLAGYVDGTIRGVYAQGGQVTGNPFFSTAGLIGMTDGANISFTFSDISGVQFGLISRLENGGSVNNSHATGNVSRGGLLGYTKGSYVANSYATGDVIGLNNSLALGGLISEYSAEAGRPNMVVNSFATGQVIGGTKLGGLIGAADAGQTILTIKNSYAKGNVTGNFPSSITEAGIGGLVGYFSGGDILIQDSYASGNVTANTAFVDSVGGLVGYLNGSGNGTSLITNSYASGQVNAVFSDDVGGLLGTSVGASVKGSYATGNATGFNNVGGLAGALQKGDVEATYSSGKAVGMKSPFAVDYSVGGLIGRASQANIDPNTYYNADGVKGSLGNAPFFFGGINSSKGLSGTQIADVQHYVNGTIDQVLADRAVQTAARQAQALQQTRIEDAGKLSNSAVSLLQRAATNGAIPSSSINQAPSIDSQIVFADTQSFSADVKSIVVDGVRFNLEEENASKAKGD
ncbi:filamentous hemagglutinin N-terminal domain-containing protein [Herminiimonas glaciei]|uniref:Filamentous hemagglutinin N-terminal domain-containing protein n=1 Tax=Herminiimonas glaciei TaxID=523788 RepID=A0ABW2I724_9BURK